MTHKKNAAIATFFCLVITTILSMDQQNSLLMTKNALTNLFIKKNLMGVELDQEGISMNDQHDRSVLSPNGKWIASYRDSISMKSYSVDLYNTHSNNKKPQEIKFSGRGAIYSVAFNPQGTLMVLSGKLKGDNFCYLYKLDNFCLYELDATSKHTSNLYNCFLEEEDKLINIIKSIQLNCIRFSSSGTELIAFGNGNHIGRNTHNLILYWNIASILSETSTMRDICCILNKAGDLPIHDANFNKTGIIYSIQDKIYTVIIKNIQSLKSFLENAHKKNKMAEFPTLFTEAVEEYNRENITTSCYTIPDKVMKTKNPQNYDWHTIYIGNKYITFTERETKNILVLHFERQNQKNGKVSITPIEKIMEYDEAIHVDCKQSDKKLIIPIMTNKTRLSADMGLYIYNIKNNTKTFFPIQCHLIENRLKQFPLPVRLSPDETMCAFPISHNVPQAVDTLNRTFEPNKISIANIPKEEQESTTNLVEFSCPPGRIQDIHFGKHFITVLIYLLDPGRTGFKWTKCPYMTDQQYSILSGLDSFSPLQLQALYALCSSDLHSSSTINTAWLSSLETIKQRLPEDPTDKSDMEDPKKKNANTNNASAIRQDSRQKTPVIIPTDPEKITPSYKNDSLFDDSFLAKDQMKENCMKDPEQTKLVPAPIDGPQIDELLQLLNHQNPPISASGFNSEQAELEPKTPIDGSQANDFTKKKPNLFSGNSGYFWMGGLLFGLPLIYYIYQQVLSRYNASYAL